MTKWSNGNGPDSKKKQRSERNVSRESIVVGGRGLGRQRKKNRRTKPQMKRNGEKKMKKKKKKRRGEEGEPASSEDLARFDEDGAEFQVVDEGVDGALERRLQQQLGLGQRRLAARLQRRPVLEGAVQPQRHAAEHEAQHQQPQKVVAQKRHVRRFWWSSETKKSKKINTQNISTCSGLLTVGKLTWAKVLFGTKYWKYTSLKMIGWSFRTHWCKLELKVLKIAEVTCVWLEMGTAPT